uniref:Secreted protein n=1 Tax=Panagrellus redivivus TaxID=6233 RepID=A0A7E4ZVZ2_PANRE
MLLRIATNHWLRVCSCLTWHASTCRFFRYLDAFSDTAASVNSTSVAPLIHVSVTRYIQLYFIRLRSCCFFTLLPFIMLLVNSTSVVPLTHISVARYLLQYFICLRSCRFFTLLPFIMLLVKRIDGLSIAIVFRGAISFNPVMHQPHCPSLEAIRLLPQASGSSEESLVGTVLWSVGASTRRRVDGLLVSGNLFFPTVDLKPGKV